MMAQVVEVARVPESVRKNDHYDGYVYVTQATSRFKAIADKSGKWIVEPGKYDDVRWIRDGFICAYKNKNFGIVNLQGKIVLPFEYSNIYPANNKQFIVYKNQMSGVVNLKNEFIIPLDSMNIRNVGVFYTLSRYRSDIKGLADQHGERILSENYIMYTPGNPDEDEFKRSGQRTVIIIKDIDTRLMGMYRADGSKILPISYTNINYQQNQHVIIVTKSSEMNAKSYLYAAVDIDGKMIVPFSGNVLSFLTYSPGVLVSTNPDKLSAFVNARTGALFTPYEYDNTGFGITLTNGYVAAKKNWRYALISPDGEKLTDAIYSDFFVPTDKNKLSFDEEIVCMARGNEKLYGITKTGKAILSK